MLKPPTSPELLTVDAQIEDYLDKVCAPLIGTLPYAARQELRQEIGAHLRSLMTSYIEAGAAPPDALRMALDKFGDPAFVAAQWNPDLRRARPIHWLRSQRQGIAATLAAGAVAALALTATLPRNRSMPQETGASLSDSAPFSHTQAVRRGMACQDCHRANEGQTAFYEIRVGENTYMVGQSRVRIGPNEIRSVGANKIRIIFPNGSRPQSP